MIVASKSPGLIVATRPRAAAALDELIDCCGWPALLHATPRQLRNELVRRAPRFSLFWLDDQRELAATSRLLNWLAGYEPAVRRFAVGYQLPESLEVAVRSAGAHVYFDATQDIRALVDDSILRWLQSDGHGAADKVERSYVDDPPASLQTALDAKHRRGEPP